MNSTLKYTVLACALMQAYAVSAQDNMQSVVVTGSKWVVTDRASIGGFSETPLLDTPASITAVSLGQMQDLSIRSATEAVRFDASVGDAYNAVG